MALVRRTATGGAAAGAAIGRAHVASTYASQPASQPAGVPTGPPATRAAPSPGMQPTEVPHQAGPAAPGAHAQMAAAADSRPANWWALMGGLGLAGAGAYGAWAISQASTPAVYHISGEMSLFGMLFVFAAAIERLLEPVTRWMPGRAQQARYEQAVADMDNGMSGAMEAVARHKASVDQARSARGLLMWGLATGLATVLSAAGGVYMLRMLSADAAWNGVSYWVDALITGLIVGSGTKPLHDVISRVQKQASGSTTPV